jgi:hypothetical protein
VILLCHTFSVQLSNIHPCNEMVSDNRQSTKKQNTYQLLYTYSIPPDDGLQICPKHVEVDWRNKLRINNASSWFSLHMIYRDALSTKHKIVQYTLTLISNLMHNIYHLFTAPTCFGHITGPSSLSYKLIRRIQYVLQADIRNVKNVHIGGVYI